MGIILRAEPNENSEIEITRVSFKSKYQIPLVMVIKEYWLDGEVVFAAVLWKTGETLKTLRRIFS